MYCNITADSVTCLSQGTAVKPKFFIMRPWRLGENNGTRILLISQSINTETACTKTWPAQYER